MDPHRHRQPRLHRSDPSDTDRLDPCDGRQSGSIRALFRRVSLPSWPGWQHPLFAPEWRCVHTCPDVYALHFNPGRLISTRWTDSVPSLTSTPYLLPIHLISKHSSECPGFSCLTVGSSTSQATFTVNCNYLRPTRAPTISPNGGIFTGFGGCDIDRCFRSHIYYTWMVPHGSEQFTIQCPDFTWRSPDGSGRWPSRPDSPPSFSSETSFIIVARSASTAADADHRPNGGTFSTCPDVTLSSIAGATILLQHSTEASQARVPPSTPGDPSDSSAIVTAHGLFEWPVKQRRASDLYGQLRRRRNRESSHLCSRRSLFNGAVIHAVDPTAGATIYTHGWDYTGFKSIRYVAPIHLTQTEGSVR